MWIKCLNEWVIGRKTIGRGSETIGRGSKTIGTGYMVCGKGVFMVTPLLVDPLLVSRIWVYLWYGLLLLLVLLLLTFSVVEPFTCTQERVSKKGREFIICLVWLMGKNTDTSTKVNYYEYI